MTLPSAPDSTVFIYPKGNAAMSDMTNYPDPPNPPQNPPARVDAPGNPPHPAAPPVEATDMPGVAHPETVDEPPDVAQPEGLDMITIAGGPEEPGETV